MQGSSTLGRSRSVPGLMALGTQPCVGKNFSRIGTLAFRLDSGVDLSWGPCKLDVDAAKDMVEAVQKPGWRVTLQDDAFAQKIPVTDPKANIPGNMRHPRVAPAWLKHDRQVLRFNGFFQEGIHERNDENCRYRHCILMYYLEDGTIRISEPKVENSGMPQGALLKRHLVPKADGFGNIGPEDFDCGQSIELYGKRFFVQSADRFTRWFYEQNGIELGPDEASPQDQFEVSYKFNKTAEKNLFPTARNVIEQKKRNEIVLGGPQPNVKLQQFLANDRRVCRFYAYWDDETLYGVRIYFTVHFFLSDNTFEMNEAKTRNSGRAPFPLFYRRAPLLKENHIDITPDKLAADPNPYLPQDFRVGQAVNVWGRKIVLYNCDDFTQKFYEEFSGIDQKAGQLSVEEPPPVHKELHPPPHTGIGSEEDSMISCHHLMPKPPKQDLVRLMTLSGELLRFEARIANGEPEDSERRLIIGSYPADDTVAVWEIQKRNSGVMGGKFSERCLKTNPATGKYFTSSDFTVGGIVTIAAQPLHIVRADEHTLKYMEANPEEYPCADWRAVARRLGAIRDDLASMRVASISPDQLMACAVNAGLEMLDHEVITLLRRFQSESADGAPLIDMAMLLQAVL